MIVVSDTTPFRYLIEIDAVHIFHSLFGKVFITQKVADELQGVNTPQKVKDWMQSPPDWIEIHKADLSLFTPEIDLHDGEREAIALALELKAGTLLIDEKNGRREAKRVGLFIVPTLAALDQAAERGLIDLPDVINKLSNTTFHATKKLFDEVLDRDRRRKEVKEKTSKKTKGQKRKRTRKR